MVQMPDGKILMGRYEIRGVLGRGGMAVVSEGWDHRLDRPVAVKMLQPWAFSQPGARERFRAEALAAASLNHPNIVAVYDSGEDDGSPLIVMERLPGGTLADDIALGPLPQVRLRAMLDNILAALATAHARQILHRDIKPGNILHAATSDIYKLGDFGIAKTGGAAHTMTGQIVGTIAYLSPERLSGAPASVADDLYAVGVVGYEALTGRHMFGPQDNIGALAKSILYDVPPPLHAARPDVDPQLAAVIERALSRDPRQRFSSADEMRAALNGHAPVVPIGPHTRPPTKVLESPLLSPTFVPPFPTAGPVELGVLRAVTTRTKRVMVAAGVIVALTVTALAFALDSPTTLPAQPVSNSTTSVPSPSPTSTLPAPPPATPPVIQQPNDVDGPPAGGNGKKGGNGKGHKKN
jgi:serine/threonine protein kinase, bacterial